MSRQASSQSVDALGQLDTAPLHDQVYVRLRQLIMAGGFLPGEMFSMQRLATTLGTSTTPVREALRRLAAERAIEIRPKRAVRIPAMSRAKFKEIGDIRVALEGLATAYAAQRITDAEIQALRALNASADEALSGADIRRYLELNQSFHFGIYGAAASLVAVPIIESLWVQIGPVQGLYSDTGVSLGSETHWEILDALVRRDSFAARRAVETDIGIGIQFLLANATFSDT
ncbi:MAG: GntR family transcriptional regulator [Alphaproteobacteria bacterium]